MSVYALVDCNNFYASCERVFNPALENTPIIVLSSNDGCVIARSNEAKVLGIPMGAPFYQYRSLCLQYEIKVFSSNFSLYGDISWRVMDSLQRLCPVIEIYSIDEAFLLLDELKHRDLAEYAGEIRQKIKMWTGIPVSIGIATSKTLAKAANNYAKHHIKSGILDLRDISVCDRVLNNLEVQQVWGIGRQLSEKLKILGIYTAKQLRDSHPKQLRKHFGIAVERIILELRGMACVSFETSGAKKSIIASRSFGRPVTELKELQEAVNHYVARACVKLREQNSKAQELYVFIQTSFHNKKESFYKDGKAQRFVEPTSDTFLMMQVASGIVKELFLPGYRYRKAGVMLEGIIPNSHQQIDLFTENAVTRKRAVLMQLMDDINRSMGKHTLRVAAQGTTCTWEVRSEKKSSSYTTNWQELARVWA